MDTTTRPRLEDVIVLAAACGIDDRSGGARARPCHAQIASVHHETEQLATPHVIWQEPTAGRSSNGVSMGCEAGAAWEARRGRRGSGGAARLRQTSPTPLRHPRSP
jgi:hypothetical protein